MNIQKFAAFVLAAAMFLGISAIPTAEESGISISASAASKLSAPSGIKAAAGTDRITLTWNKVNGADAYRVYMYDSYSKKFKKIKTTAETKATVTGLKNNKTYYFMLSAVKKSGNSYVSGEYSKQFKVTTKSVGNENLILTEYYIPNREKGSDYDYIFDYDSNGRISGVKLCYCKKPHGEEYEFKHDIAGIWSEFTIEYSENKVILTKQYIEEDDTNDNNNNTDAPVAVPIESYVITMTYNKNFDVESIIINSQKNGYSTISTTKYTYDKNNNLVSKSCERKNNKTGKFKVTSSDSIKFNKGITLDLIGDCLNSNLIYKTFNKKIDAGTEKLNKFILNYFLTYVYQEIYDSNRIYR
ncbi:MAG: fibronectin type III domain-containing protein [Oscillospiraceae bacterium]